MDGFARLAPGDRLDAFRAAAARRKIGVALLEKDFWVCWTLRRIFELKGPGAGIIFKGGTSLSKVFEAIERFSEDIDLSLDRGALGFGGDKDPSEAPSRKQRERRLEELTEACRHAIKTGLMPALKKTFAAALGTDRSWSLELAADDPDQQTLAFQYPSAAGAASAYVRPIVRMEFGARSDHWPAADGVVVPYVAEDLPSLFEKPEARVHVLSAERTFWEKVTALHAWHCSGKAAVADRRSRHYYDVARLHEHGVGEKALQNFQLLADVARHKSLFYPAASAHYEWAKPGTLRLTPPPEQLGALRRDYTGMAEMFFRPPPSFDHILEVLAAVEKTVNAK